MTDTKLRIGFDFSPDGATIVGVEERDGKVYVKFARHIPHDDGYIDAEYRFTDLPLLPKAKEAKDG